MFCCKYLYWLLPPIERYSNKIKLLYFLNCKEKNKMEIKIIVACHKKNVMTTQYPYGSIRVGKDLHLDINLGVTARRSGNERGQSEW